MEGNWLTWCQKIPKSSCYQIDNIVLLKAKKSAETFSVLITAPRSGDLTTFISSWMGSHGDTPKWSQIRGGRFNETFYILTNKAGSGQNCPNGLPYWRRWSLSEVLLHIIKKSL